MKKIIKISPLNKTLPKYKRVEWWLHNVCNFNCSFCEERWKSGSLRWLDLSVYTAFADKLMKQATEQDTYVFFQFLGGEPTLYPQLLNLSKHIVDKGHFVEYMSNGSRTINYWKEIAEADVLNTLYLTIHPEQTSDIKHYVDVINLFEDKNVLVVIKVTAPNNFFNEALNFCDVIDQETSSIIAIQPINELYKNNAYTIEQINHIKQKNYYFSKKFKMPKREHFYPWRFEVTDEFNNTHSTYPGEIYTNNLANFKNYTCYSGVDFLKIFCDEIYKANCEQDGMIGKIYDENFGFLSEPTTCTKNWCFCRADIAIEKFKN